MANPNLAQTYMYHRLKAKWLYKPNETLANHKVVDTPLQSCRLLESVKVSGQSGCKPQLATRCQWIDIARQNPTDLGLESSHCVQQTKPPA